MFGKFKKSQTGDSKKALAFSQKLIADIRCLLWVITVGGLLLAFYCVHSGYAGSLPWTAHGTVCAFYLNMAKSDHSSGGITFEAAKANGFSYDQSNQEDGSWESPTI